MTTAELLRTAWDWEPSVVVGCAALAASYLAVLRGADPQVRAGPPGPASRSQHQVPANPGRPAWGLAADRGSAPLSFLSGTLLLLLALVSPIDTLGDGYLFSAHVVQHFLLALVIPPLWLLGIPRSLGHVHVPPPIAWLLGVGTMIAWHIPTLFNAALASDGLHIFQHLSFLVTGTIFWWPVLSPVPERRLPTLGAISYLFSACVSCSLLGAVLTFTPPGAYPAYLNPEDHLGILRLVRDDWGLDPKSDQQLGGLLMWVPGCLVYLSGILATAARWYATAGQEI